MEYSFLGWKDPFKNFFFFIKRALLGIALILNFLWLDSFYIIDFEFLLGPLSTEFSLEIEVLWVLEFMHRWCVCVCVWVVRINQKVNWAEVKLFFWLHTIDWAERNGDWITMARVNPYNKSKNQKKNLYKSIEYKGSNKFSWEIVVGRDGRNKDSQDPFKRERERERNQLIQRKEAVSIYSTGSGMRQGKEKLYFLKRTIYPGSLY